MQLCSVKLSAASLLSDVGLRDQQLQSDCYSNFQALQMFVSDTVTPQMLFAFICKANLVFTPQTPCRPGNVNFFHAISYLVFDRSNVSEEMLKAFVCILGRPRCRSKSRINRSKSHDIKHSGLETSFYMKELLG